MKAWSFCKLVVFNELSVLIDTPNLGDLMKLTLDNSIT